MAEPLRCLIVDDNPSFLEAARTLLEREGLTIVGVASNGAGALGEADSLRPDVILIDISLGQESGLDVARRLQEGKQSGGATVILISTHSPTDFADLIGEAPAAGFLPKADLSADAIRTIVEKSRNEAENG
jgi:two-component system, NarL family, nitrate/nitrite response regulator NarL